MDISELGKGAILQPEDPRDFDFTPIMAASAPIDWNVEFSLPEPPDENQNTSLSCVAQSTSYLHWQLSKKDFTRRDVYARIFLPQGGAYLRDGVKSICTVGQSTRDEVKDPSPQTEPTMRDKAGLSDLFSMSDIEANYFQIRDGSIEGVATAIRDYKGCIFGLYGDNRGGWKDLTNPHPPKDNASIDWAHALYAFAYHMHDGQKCIIAKSSWCNPNHRVHHIKEEYFIKQMTFNGWVVIPKDQLMFATEKIKVVTENGTSFGVMVKTPDVINLILADTAPEFAAMGKGYGVVTMNPDGTPNFEGAREIILF